MRRLFGYYRQFDELSPDEVSRELLARRDEERRRHPATPAAAGPVRRGVARAAAPRGDQRRDVRAAAGGQRVPGRRAAAGGDRRRRTTSIRRGSAIGHGAGELIRAALRAVATPETEIVWPGWGLLPGLVSEAGATPVPVAAMPTRRPRDRSSCAAPTIPPARSREVDDLVGDHWLILDEALAGFLDRGLACSTTRG